MDFHGINMQGIFYIENQQTLPPFEPNRDRRRFIIVPEGDVSSLYYGGSNKWFKLSIQEGVNNVINGGTGVNWIPRHNLLIGDAGNHIKFINPDEIGNVLTVDTDENGQKTWKSLPLNIQITCKNKGDIQSHDGISLKSLEVGSWFNPYRILTTNPNSNIGLEWSDIFDNNNFCKTGMDFFSAFGNETEILNPFTTEPRFVFITNYPRDDQKEMIGSIGEYWIRKTNSSIFVGNTGSAKCRFLWLAIK